MTQEGENVKALLEKKMNELTDLKAESDALRQQVGKLQETLTSSTKALETERELRRVSEGNAKSAVQHHEDLEKQTRRAHEELERANKDQAAVIAQTKEELKKAALQIQSLESEVNTLATEKMHAEQEIRALTKSTTDREQAIARQTQATETLNETVRQKEQTILALARECEELKKTLKKETDERNDLTVEFAALRQQVGDTAGNAYLID